MEILTLVMLAIFGAYILRSGDERQRIALLGTHLGHYQIEKLMESLTEGYLRCLGEDDPERRAQIWRLLEDTEARLSAQFDRFTAEFQAVDEARARVSRLPIGLPYASRLFPRASFDLRRALAIHARGIGAAMRNDLQRPPKAKAFTMSAELFLMQHTCHWYCKSRMVASARMLARHRTPYRQLVDSVSDDTRKGYLALVAG